MMHMMWHLRGQIFGYYSCPYFSLPCTERGICKFESRSDRGDLNIKKCTIFAPKMTQRDLCVQCDAMQLFEKLRGMMPWRF